MSLSIIISSILFGLILSSLVSFLEMSLSKKQRWLLAIMEITLGTLGAVSAQYLLAGACGPVLLGLSVVPMTTGVLVMMGFVRYAYSKLA